jgi:leader peptidase (prepilin peptidase)/N-methyltransferase
MSCLPIFLVILLACWGSFLNSLAYRLVHDGAFARLRSFCPNCGYNIAWHDLVPIISWCYLRGKCRNCQQPISWLYPALELITVLTGLGLVYTIPPAYFLAYAIFCSALLITIRTDLQTMLISRFVTLFLIPVPLILSLIYFNHDFLLPITIFASVKGALFGYFVLYFINKFFWLLTKKQGMGEGDMELLAMIGSFTGITGAWVSLMLGSFLGSLVGIILMYVSNHKTNLKIPFGPFLATSAIIYVLFQNQILNFLFY